MQLCHLLCWRCSLANANLPNSYIGLHGRASLVPEPVEHGSAVAILASRWQLSCFSVAAKASSSASSSLQRLLSVCSLTEFSEPVKLSWTLFSSQGSTANVGFFEIETVQRQRRDSRSESKACWPLRVWASGDPGEAWVLGAFGESVLISPSLAHSDTSGLRAPCNLFSACPDFAIPRTTNQSLALSLAPPSPFLFLPSCLCVCLCQGKL